MEYLTSKPLEVVTTEQILTGGAVQSAPGSQEKLVQVRGGGWFPIGLLAPTWGSGPKNRRNL